MENKVKTVAVKTAPKSQKGKRGNQVGAPPKVVKLPRGNFTMDKVYALNPSICELTCRKDVTSRVVGFRVDGNGESIKVPKTLKVVGTVPQPDGKVGRPSFKYGLVGVKVAQPTKSKTAKTVKTKSVPIATVTAKTATVPVVITPKVTTPAVTTPAVTTPAVTTPAV